MAGDPRAARALPASGECHLWLHRGTGARRALAAVLTSYLPASCPRAEVRTCGHCGGTDHGKPALVIQGAPSVVRFNLAHAGPLRVLAVAAGVDVGVDVELPRPGFDWSPVLALAFSPAERAAIAAMSPRRRDRACLEAWVTKEAVLKGRGIGLAGDPGSVEAAVPGRRAWPGWSVRLVDLDDELGSACAVALRGALAGVVVRQADGAPAGRPEG